MSLPPPPSLTVTRAHATSVAHRLLAGAGQASFVAYRRAADRAITIAAHGLTPAGDIVVCHLDQDVPGGAAGAADVRLDIRREAAEAQVRILAATVHLLGRIEWLSPTSVEQAAQSAWLPEAVDTLAGVPGVAIGLVRTERVLVHEGAGICPLTPAEIVAAGRQRIYPAASEELRAQEIVAALDPDLLAGVVAGTLSGRLPGEVLNERSGPPACGATIGRIYCVDVDASGLTLMHVGAASTTVVFTPFREPVRDHAQLSAQIAGLLPRTRP